MARTGRGRVASSRQQGETATPKSKDGLDGNIPVRGSDAAPGLETFTVPFKDKSTVCNSRGHQGAEPQLLFTHGAGGGIEDSATKSFAEGFSASGARIVCFQGTMNLKSRTQSFITVAEHLQKARGGTFTTAFGGRSMGSRAAVLAAQEAEGTGPLILASYPLTNAKGNVRDKILLDIEEDRDVLFISGDKDNMCNLNELAAVRAKMKARSWMLTVAGADHGMGLRPKAAVETLRQETGKFAAQWLRNHSGMAQEMTVAWDEATDSVIRKDDSQKSVEQPSSQKRAAHPSPTPENPMSRKRRKNAA